MPGIWDVAIIKAPSRTHAGHHQTCPRRPKPGRQHETKVFTSANSVLSYRRQALDSSLGDKDHRSGPDSSLGDKDHRSGPDSSLGDKDHRSGPDSSLGDKDHRSGPRTRISSSPPPPLLLPSFSPPPFLPTWDTFPSGLRPSRHQVAIKCQPRRRG